LPLPADLQIVVFVPDFEMPTQESRRYLRLSREDTVFNVGRAALVAALGTGRRPAGRATQTASTSRHAANLQGPIT
jgi:homoserine kinase